MTALPFTEETRGVLSKTALLELHAAGRFGNLPQDNIRPASVDLEISDEVYHVPHMFKPKIGQSVSDVLAKIPKTVHSLSQPLLPDQIYVAKLAHELRLPNGLWANVNPKSTTGRLATHVRLLSDGVPYYDSIWAGSEGSSWLSIIPRITSIDLWNYRSLNQARLLSANTKLPRWELNRLLDDEGLLYSGTGKQYRSSDIRIWDPDDDHSMILTLEAGQSPDLKGFVGWEALPEAKGETLDLSKKGFYDPYDFFKPVEPKNGCLHLHPGTFYLLSTAEWLRVPRNLTCEMISMSDRFGDGRWHAAGFIDNGWGRGKDGMGRGRPITLEVWPYEEWVIPHHQPVAKIRFERVVRSGASYEEDGTYTDQWGVRLPKQFKQPVF